MIVPEIREKILECLDQLSPAMQRRAAELVHELRVRQDILAGEQAADEGRVVSHEDVKTRFV